jgi:hypothetical protein
MLAKFLAAMVFVSVSVFVLAILFAGADYYSSYRSDPSPPPPPSARYLMITAIISVLTFLVGAIGTSFIIFFGWRKERRESEEVKLKLRHLELQIAQLSAGKTNSN